MIIRRNPRGTPPRSRFTNEEAAVSAKLRHGCYDVLGVHATCADEYQSPGSPNIDYVPADGQKRERYDLCRKADQEMMAKDPWYAELRRIAEIHKKMLEMQKADRTEYRKAYDGFMEEIREASVSQRGVQEAREREWIAATERDEALVKAETAEWLARRDAAIERRYQNAQRK